MIHYPVTQSELVSAIDSALGTAKRRQAWWAKAYGDFLRAVKDRTHDAKQAYWSDIKEAYITLQCNKCAYCETPMPQGSKALIAYDVEHYRPKSATTPWPTNEMIKLLDITYKVNAGRNRGYPELAHHPYNYAVACKVCNSSYKSSFFPILGKPDATSYVVAQLNKREHPAIPLPLGDWGEDPSPFLTFEGFIAVPASNDELLRKRAQVVIDFFELNRRPDLLLGRATAIVVAYQHLKELKQPDLAPDVAIAQAWVDGDLSQAAPFAAAVRAFKLLFDTDEPRAREVARLANSYISKKSPNLAQSLASKPVGSLRSMKDVLAALN